MMTFRDFIASFGIVPPEIMTPGRWQQCALAIDPRKKKGRVKLSEDGSIGWVFHYKRGEKGTWHRDGAQSKAERTAEDNAALSAKLAKAREDERKAILRCREEYGRATAILGAANSYLARKRVGMLGCIGLRVDAAGNILIPMWRGGKLVSIQRISADGEKKFATGCPAKLATFTIDRPGAVIQILAEGFATAATCFEALPMARVVVCFSASNMVAVAEHGDWIGSVIVAGDNDAMTKEIHGKNPGEEAAQKAAAALGCGYAIPPGDGDWNDVFVEQFEKLEDQEEFKKFKISPAKLRAIALAPIRAELLKNLRKSSIPSVK